MLPRLGRAHDQLLRAIWVAGIGGLVVGHILWLVAISLAINTTTVSRWVLVVVGLSVVLGAVAGWRGWRHYRENSHVWTAFLWCLPAAPVLFSLGVLGVTYL
jgi:predicted alpha/beta hydrolase